MAISEKNFKKLKQIVGADNITKTYEELFCYSYDASTCGYLPDAVVFPKTVKEVSEIVLLANCDKFFLIPRGAGSGMTGGSIATLGGVVVAMNRFNRIIEIDKNNFIAIVEPGVITNHLHQAVEKEGLFYPPDPASSTFSTIGGNLAECAGGPRAVKYGVTRDYVLGLEVVLPTGEIINTGVKTAKGVVGYDLTRLIVGSEGTLGIITKAILKLIPLPEAAMTMMVVFDEMETAAHAVSQILRRGYIPKTIEYMDNASIRCVEDYLKIGLPIEASALLLIEVDGKKDELTKLIEPLKILCEQLGAKETKIAKTKEETESLWKARKAVSPALFRYAPDKINEDIVVPKDKIPDMVHKIKELSSKTGLLMATFGHAGDGNIHCNIMLDKKDKEQVEKAKYALDEIFNYTLKLGGTISGEHGVGITKRDYISKEIGRDELNLMKRIKSLFDPKGILNPGKIFPV
ncbi:MAG: FAD-binding protein [Desulfobacterales bacterium]|nr:FAD-binding protein [Desulfobacterales bacterium]